MCHIGEEQVRDHNYRWNGRERGDDGVAIWQYTLEGEGQLQFGKQTFKLTPGQAFLLTVPQDHEYSLPSHSKSWRFVHVTLKGREPIRLWKWLLQLYGPVCHFERKGATVSLFHELMARYAMKEGLSPYENSQLAYRFCMTLISELQCDSEDEVGVARAMRQVETYCLQHLGERLDIVRLSKIAGYSRFHFSRLFKQHFGVSPSVYVKKMKLDRAKYLLNHRGLGVSEVSTQMGFEDSSYFCRIYRAEYGTSPKGKP